MELYNANDMSLSNDPQRRAIQEKYLRGEALGVMEKAKLGRDNPVKEIDGYELKPDHCYRAVKQHIYDLYMQQGYINGVGPDDEYMEYEEDGRVRNNNRGVDWYLGGAGLKYGDVIIECPADKEYFVPAFDNGCGMAVNPNVRFFKSSGHKKPIPTSMISRVFNMKEIREKQKANFDQLRKTDMANHEILRDQQLGMLQELNELEQGAIQGRSK